MIPYFLFSIMGILLIAVAAVFSALPFTIPTILFSPITIFISLTGYLSGLLDLTVFYQCIGYLLLFEVFWFLFLIAWWVIEKFLGIFSRR